MMAYIGPIRQAGIIIFVMMSSLSQSTQPPRGMRTFLTTCDLGTRRQVPSWVATEGRQIILKTLERGREERKVSWGRLEVETREIKVCLLGSKMSFDMTSSSCAGRTQTNMTSEESKISWLLPLSQMVTLEAPNLTEGEGWGDGGGGSCVRKC